MPAGMMMMANQRQKSNTEKISKSDSLGADTNTSILGAAAVSRVRGQNSDLQREMERGSQVMAHPGQLAEVRKKAGIGLSTSAVNQHPKNRRTSFAGKRINYKDHKEAVEQYDQLRQEAEKLIKDGTISRSFLVKEFSTGLVSMGSKYGDAVDEEAVRVKLTDGCGHMDFWGKHNKLGADYVRLSDDSNPGAIRAMMEREWKFAQPNLLISVTGGAQAFNRDLDPRIIETFKRGMMKAAIATNGWIITGGSDAGVMELTGKAVDEYGSSVPLLGIASWGTVTNRKCLLNKRRGEQGTVQRHSNAGMGHTSSAVYVKSKKNGATCCALDPNHTGFLLVDNGTEGQWGVESSLRAKVEQAICFPNRPWLDMAAGIEGLEDGIPQIGITDPAHRWRQARRKEARKHMHRDEFADEGREEVPMICLCFEGGPGTIKTCYEVVNSGFPVIVMEGSGRASDVICAAFEYYEKVVDIAEEAGENDENLHDIISEFAPPGTETYIEFHEQVNIYRQIRLKQAEVNRLLQEADMEDSVEDYAKAESTESKYDAEGGGHGTVKSSSPMVMRQKNVVVRRKCAEVSVIEQNEELHDLMSLRMPIIEKIYFDKFKKYNPEHTEWCAKIVRCRTTRNNSRIGVLRVDMDGHETEQLILQTILRGMDINIGEQLRLAIHWGHVEVAIQGIFEEIDSEVDSEDLQHLPRYLQNGLEFALQKNQVDFVELMLSRGATPDAFGSSVLDDLYRICFPRVLENNTIRFEGDSARLQYVYEMLSDRRGNKGPLHSAEVKSGTHEKVKLLDKQNPSSPVYRLFNDKLMGPPGFWLDTGLKVPTVSYKDLVMWACLTRRFRMAMKMWERCTDPLNAGIIAANIFEALAHEERHTNYEAEERKEMKKLSDRFEMRVVDLLNRCQDTNQRKTMNALDMKWGSDRFTTLDIAYYGKNSEIISHPISQMCIKARWTSEVANETRFELVLFCSLVIPFAPFLLTFTDGETKSKSYTYKERLKIFLNAPQTKFCINFLFDLVLLALYSIMTLQKFEADMNSLEWMVCGWMISKLTEEIVQVHVEGYQEWSQNPWNQGDGVIYALYFSAVLLRVQYEPSTLLAARVIYSINAICLWVRLFNAFTLFQSLGPLVLIIVQMLNKDIRSFVIVMIIITFGFGTCLTSLNAPSGFNWYQSGIVDSFGFILKSLEKPLWRFVGQIEVEDLDCSVQPPSSESTDALLKDNLCDYSYDTTPGKMLPVLNQILTFFYVLFTNIVLVNLLVAQMSDTYANIRQTSYQTWRMLQYKLVREYELQPTTPSPFIIFWRIYRVVVNVYTKARAAVKVSAVPHTSSTLGRSVSDFLEVSEMDMTSRNLRNQAMAHIKDCQLAMLLHESKKEAAAKLTATTVAQNAEMIALLHQQVQQQSEAMRALLNMQKQTMKNQGLDPEACLNSTLRKMLHQ